MRILMLPILTLWLACAQKPAPAALMPEILPAAAASDSLPQGLRYGWRSTGPLPGECLAHRVVPPDGCTRTPVETGSFAEWLRYLPLLPGTPQVLLYDGSPKGNQSAHAGVFDLDVSPKDLQQCADAVMRLRAEYLWAAGKYDAIHFNATSGALLDFKRWRQGYRPKLSGNTFVWSKTAAPDNGHACFRKYIDYVFNWAGTASLSRELKARTPAAMQPGDVFILGGHPGHAVLVLDMAADAQGKKWFLLGQSYMPAQQFQLLKNPEDPAHSPWFPADFGETLYTPEWSFTADQLKQWPE